MDDWASRKGIFTGDENYRVKRDIPAGISQFKAGELLRFQAAGYSRYDECWVYEFSTVDQTRKSWMLHDESPKSSWMNFFEPA